MHREDFPLLKSDIVYLDNAATSLKPQCVIDKVTEYYRDYSANAHRGDYDLSYKVDQEYEGARRIVADFIHARDLESVIFTSGATQGLNMIADGFFRKFLDPGDEILITTSEHASNVMPWFRLERDLGVKVKNIALDDNHYVTLDNVKKAITPQTKVISLAWVTNVLGDARPIKEIASLAHEHNIFLVVDAAQAIAHQKCDVELLDVDFLVFSGHKIYGPTGIGVLYGKKELLSEMEPQNLGGGMNESFETPNHMVYSELPHRLEAGTPNIAGALGLGAALLYLQKIGLETIWEYERHLRSYAMQKLIQMPHLDILNIEADSSTIAFNVEKIFSQDVAYYLNKYKVCVRAGNHCAKNLKNAIGVTNSLRVSLAFYNNESDIDALCELLENKEKILKEML